MSVSFPLNKFKRICHDTQFVQMFSNHPPAHIKSDEVDVAPLVCGASSAAANSWAHRFVKSKLHYTKMKNGFASCRYLTICGVEP